MEINTNGILISVKIPTGGALFARIPWEVAREGVVAMREGHVSAADMEDWVETNLFAIEAEVRRRAEGLTLASDDPRITIRRR